MKSTNRILIIEDDESIRKYLKMHFNAHGFDIEAVSSLKESTSLLSGYRPDLVILDLTLPDGEGATLLVELRKWSAVPVIVVTARSSDAEKVALLDLGADDYVVKPFSIDELLARVRVSLRRTKPEPFNSSFKNGPLEIFFEDKKANWHSEEIKLTATEFDILKTLAQNCGKTMTQKDLLVKIWGPNHKEHGHYLRIYISHLRKKFLNEEESFKLISTESGIGYRMNFWNL